MSATGTNNAAPGRRVNTFDVFVGNLPQDADQKMVGKIFSKFGEIHTIWINSNNDGKKFAIVKFYCEEDSNKAIDDINGMVCEGGKPLTCRKANKTPKRNLSKKEGEQDGQDTEDLSKDSTPQVRQRNPDIVPSFESKAPTAENKTPTFESKPPSFDSKPPSFEGSFNSAASNPGLVKKDKERVLISHVETPIVMWGQRMLVDNANDLANISEQLALICPESPTITGKPDQEKIYGAKFSEDEQWYRCTIRYIFSHDRIKVQYIDFGNTEEINPSTLVELPKSITALPTCAMKYMLHGVWCNNNQDPAGIAFLREMVEGKEVEVFPTARLTDQTGFYSKVYVDGISVLDKMLEAGHAFKKPGLEARGVRARMNAGGMGDVGGVNQKMAGMTSIRDGGGPRKMEGALMAEKDELANLRWKLKALQMEHSAIANKIQENNLGVQIRDIKTLVCRVRTLRNQFPLDKDTPIDLAIRLVEESPSKINLSMAESVPALMTTIETYKRAQDDIVRLASDSSLEKLIEERNNVRKNLHGELTTAVEELKKIPLQDRGKQVKEVVEALLKHYDYFTKMGLSNPVLITELSPAFQEWKASKQTDVRDSRRQSDTMESAVNSYFDHLRLVVSLDPDQEEVDTNEDLMSCLKNYTMALRQEIAVFDTQEHGPDYILIGSLVQTLLKELKEESICVNHLEGVKREFGNLLEAITPWLESSPNLETLQEVKKKLKGLKSKLRHKLADKIDAEENQDTEELETIAEDLEHIRSKLHAALIEEDKIMDNFSHLANAHFPELLLESADTGFKMCLKYNGLLKPSYAPEHFTMTSIGDGTSGIYASQFAGKDVVIKEYFLNSGNHLGKEEFLDQMTIFCSTKSPFLEPVSAVFFDKNSRHAYVMMEKNGELLSELAPKSALSKETCKSIVGCLSRGLDVLNRMNIIHGQVRPEFVTVAEDGKAHLLPPDFSLSATDRCNCRFLPGSGIEMIAPELRHQALVKSDASHFTDVYYLGLLTLWMHHPNGNFLLRKDGAVDFGHLSLDRNLGIFLTKLLAAIPHTRPTAENTLHSEYLSQSDQSGAMPRSGQLMDGSAMPDYSRNSASPVVLSQTSDGRVFANNGANVQIIADLRVPPPLFHAENSGLMQAPVGNYHPHQQQQHHQQQYQHQQQQHQQHQHQQQQHQQQSQQQQQQQQQQQFSMNMLSQHQLPLQQPPLPALQMSSHPTDQAESENQHMSHQMTHLEQKPMSEDTTSNTIANNGSGGGFEIGTFDPSAFERCYFKR